MTADRADENWLARYYSGVVGWQESVRETRDFAVVRIPGRHHHSGTGRPWSYARQHCDLVDKREDYFRDRGRVLVWRSGRLTPHAFHKFRVTLEERQKAEEAVRQ